VSSAVQKADLDRQVARVTACAAAQQIPVDKVVVEVGSALNGHRRKFRAVLGDPWVSGVWWSTGTGSADSVRMLALDEVRPLKRLRRGAGSGEGMIEAPR